MDREKIEEKYKWKLEDLYENKEEYDKDLIKLSELVDEFEKYKGKILENDNTLLETLLLDEKIDMLTNKLYVYANMKLHEDTRVGVNQELAGNLDITLANINERISFFVPELLEKDYSYVEKLIEKNDKLERFKFLLEVIFNEKDHILSKEIEALMSRTGNILSIPDNVFSNLNDADLVFGEIKDENGKNVELTKANYYIYSLSKDRRVRKEAFETLYKKYKEETERISGTSPECGSAEKSSVTYSICGCILCGK